METATRRLVLIMPPTTDSCWTCQKNNTPINKSPNLPEVEKVDAVRRQEEHLCLTSGEREYYKMARKETKACVQPHLEEADFALRSDRDLAHTKEQYITHTTTQNSCTIPPILTS